MASGQKHVIKCRCILHQFKTKKNPPTHSFVVFSIINDDDSVVSKYVQCNNCGIIHKVTDIGRSEIINGKEHMSSIVTLNETKMSIPERLVILLEANNVDQPTWEYTKFIIDNERWGDCVVLSTDETEGTKQGKYVIILGENLFKIESFVREEVLT